ncbi:HNH endonuclease [Geodermatophilus sp. SYSU D00691]
MIGVPFSPELLDGDQREWFQGWNRRAEDAMRTVLERWEKTGTVKFSAREQKLWGELKNWLLENVFFHKCAYCERKLYKQSVDAEHYRPKAGVRWAKAQGHDIVKVVRSDGTEAPHPGYFWLALDWRNLVPACEGCNARDGKLNQFPVAKTHAAVASPPVPHPAFQALDLAEEPLLLHPFVDDPTLHLRFGEFGEVVGLTEKGRISIQVYDLNNDEQRRARSKAQLAAEGVAQAAVYARPRKCSIRVARQQAFNEALASDEAASARAEYAAAVRAWLQEVLPGI